MAFVLDTSVSACWAFIDEDHPAATRALERLQNEEALVPALWWFEIRNSLIVQERRKRISEADTSRFLRDLARFPIRTDNSPDESAILRLARAHRLSVYDAAYLELALRGGLPLATLDADLASAARAESVPVLRGAS